MKPSHLDLFSGIGGFSLAASWAGFETIAFCEIDPYAQQVLSKNFGAVLADAAGARRKRAEDARTSSSDEGSDARGCSQSERSYPRIFPDITKLDGKQFRGVDLLTGGFPCQPFSLAGKRGGSSDDRALWPQMRRIIDEARPRWVIGENVPGIINMELDAVLSDLEALGYIARPIVVPACAVDAKHRRMRVWIVAHATEGGIRCGGAQGESGQFALSGEIAAGARARTLEHAESGGCGEPRPASRRDAPGKNENGSGQSSEAISYTHSESQNRVADAWQKCRGRPVKSSLGGMVDGLPAGMDGVARWPEEDPQVPRTAQRVKQRVGRLKGLGNAIVPQVAYEIIKRIREYETSEGRTDHGLRQMPLRLVLARNFILPGGARGGRGPEDPQTTTEAQARTRGLLENRSTASKTTNNTIADKFKSQRHLGLNETAAAILIERDVERAKLGGPSPEFLRNLLQTNKTK